MKPPIAVCRPGRKRTIVCVFFLYQRYTMAAKVLSTHELIWRNPNLLERSTHMAALIVLLAFGMPIAIAEIADRCKRTWVVPRAVKKRYVV